MMHSGNRLKGTLDVVTMLLRKTGTPMSVREIVELAGADLPTRSKTPVTVVARDLAMDIKLKGEASAYIRTSPGRFTLRELVSNDGRDAVRDDVVVVHTAPPEPQFAAHIPRPERVLDSVQLG